MESFVEQCEICRREEKLIAAIKDLKEKYANLGAAAKASGEQNDEKKFNEGYNICIKYLQDRCVRCLLESMCIIGLDKDLYNIKGCFPNSVKCLLNVWEEIENGMF